MKNTFTLLFCLFIYSTFAQPVFRTYSDHGFIHVLRIPGNELLLVGNNYDNHTSEIWRLQANGDTIWSLSLADEPYVWTGKVNVLPDGNYITCGVVRTEPNRNRPSFRKISAAGQVTTTVHHSLSKNFNVESVHPLPDQTFLAVGTTGYNILYNYALLRLDSTLENVLSLVEFPIEEDTLIHNWQSVRSSYLNAEQQTVISLTNDVVSGPNVNSNCWVVKSDVDGQLLWKIALDYNDDDYATDLAIFPDNSILVTGRTRDNETLLHKLFLTKLDSSGTVVWERILTDSSTNAILLGSMVLLTASGDLALVTTRSDSSGRDILVMLLDNNGMEKNRLLLEREIYNDVAASIAWLDNEVLTIAGGEVAALNVQSGLLILLPLSLLTVTKEVVFENEQFQVFPNPFETKASIQYNEPNALSEALRLDVYSSTGRKVYEGGVSDSIALQHLPAGMYCFILTDRRLSKSFVRKVVKR